MAEVWVPNASPVIVLAKAGHLELLQQLSGELLLPEAVTAEILAGPQSDPARQALEMGWTSYAPWIPGRRRSPAKAWLLR